MEASMDEKYVTSESKKEVNRAWWNALAPLHAKSDFYDLQALIEGKSSLAPYEKIEVGDVTGKKLCHLQCHIGAETISWARLGAQVTALDFSENAIKEASRLAEACNLDIDFVVSDVYESLSILEPRSFDIVYVNIGSLRCLPDINAWAYLVFELLNDNGILYVHELHPIAAIMDDDRPLVTGNYFETTETLWIGTGSYALEEGTVKDASHEYGWERPLGDIVTAIAQAGFRIELLHEHEGHVDKQYTYLVKDDAKRRWVAPQGIASVPALYSLRASKRVVL
jgi:2-polyprenyl-3-methyl-5-hydroxy-6-metoxy-1,4-benzoquinol methylase